jgi:hypothetical protein
MNSQKIAPFISVEGIALFLDIELLFSREYSFIDFSLAWQAIHGLVDNGGRFIQLRINQIYSDRS